MIFPKEVEEPVIQPRKNEIVPDEWESNP
jgi:hypothetical protein